jgi:hypothetical protein
MDAFAFHTNISLGISVHNSTMPTHPLPELSETQGREKRQKMEALGISIEAAANAENRQVIGNIDLDVSTEATAVKTPQNSRR